MHSRREFLQAGIAASIVPIAMPAHAIARGTAATRSVPPEDQFFAIVYDVRFEEAALLASSAERAGLPVTRITGDITDFWFNELSRRWKSQTGVEPVSQTAAPVAIAGFTAHGPLFCLERLGWDHGMRVVSRGAHRTRVQQPEELDELLSWVIAPRYLVNRLDAGSRSHLANRLDAGPRSGLANRRNAGSPSRG
jgi:hypothetical protein